ncbi:hypothetical protein [Streptococcus sp. 20-1249]|uniref:hypothetical protein n=1 Tax=Streptococcus hepaticus TaxID=3349163 RepID=UPI00374879C3
MAKGTLLEKNSFVMRIHQATATHPENGEEIDISITGCTPAITYKERVVVWDIQEMINEAVDLIESELNKEKEC